MFRDLKLEKICHYRAKEEDRAKRSHSDEESPPRKKARIGEISSTEFEPLSETESQTRGSDGEIQELDEVCRI